MMRPKILLLVPALCAAFLSSGCNNNSLLTQPTASGPATQITEDFPGTLTVNGGVTFPFAEQQTGTITATLTALSPDPSVTVGMLLGTWNGVSCSISTGGATIADSATVNTTITGNATGTGNFCVRIYDVGKLTAPTDFDVSIVHF